MEGKEDPQKEKKKQNQPAHHAAKSKTATALRRKKILKALVDGKTNQQAGIIAGLNPNHAGDQVSQILSEPKTAATFKQLLDRDVPDEMQTAKYLEILNATKVISANIINPQGDGMADAHSRSKDFIDVPDYPTQLRANDSISKLKGYLIEKTQETGELTIKVVKYGNG